MTLMFLAIAAWASTLGSADDPPTIPFLAEEAHLTAPVGGLNAQFGYSVSVAGDTIVIGAPQELVGTPPSANGAAHVFVRSGTAWIHQQKLQASDPRGFDKFGIATSISGETAIIGAAALGTANAGSAYAFVRSGATWTEQQKLTPSDTAGHDAFGVSVSISGDTAVVGAPWTPAGSAYVFVRSGTAWSEQQKLTASDGADGDAFGWSVSISGDTALVGAPYAGAAYVFVRSGTTWTQQQKLVAGAWSVSVSGDTAVVTGPSDGYSAYVFVRSGTVWSQQQTLMPPAGAGRDGFGAAVSVEGDTVAIGAPAFIGGTDPGAAYVFARSGTAWGTPQKILASDGVGGDQFGGSVAASGNTVVVGAIWDETPAGMVAGSAYVFRPAVLAFFALPPCRAIDTRASGPALAANSTRTFAVAGLCQVPADARAVAANLTAVNPGALGNLRLYATGQPVPSTSALNFAAGDTRANNAIALLGLGGQVNVRCDMPPGSTASTHFVLDVTGYFK